MSTEISPYPKCPTCSARMENVGRYALTQDEKQYIARPGEEESIPPGIASWQVYECPNGHKHHLSLNPDGQPCPVCTKPLAIRPPGPHSPHFSFVCSCGFTAYQTGIILGWPSDPNMPGDCVLCGEPALIADRYDSAWYELGSDKDQPERMKTAIITCRACSASYLLNICPYCESGKVTRSREREDVKVGKNFAVWKEGCHCHACGKEWHVGAGWSD